MAGRSRKRHAPGATPVPRPPRRSAEERAQEIRDQLEPLGPGERPPWLLAAAALAAALGVLTLVLVAVGGALTGSEDRPVLGIAQAAILLIVAGGMWKAQYWATLGFEMLLGITMIYGIISVMFAGNVLGVVLGLLVTTVATILFWKLIRIMARIQLTSRPAAQAPR